MLAPSPYWCEEMIWKSPASAHNAMVDQKGRVWLASAIRPATREPAFCRSSSNPFAKYFRLERSGRQNSYYEPLTGKFTFVDTCFATHHLFMAEDKDNTMYYSGEDRDLLVRRGAMGESLMVSGRLDAWIGAPAS